MRNLLLTLAVAGLVAMVHSTSSSASPEDIYREVETDGYLIAPVRPSSESKQVTPSPSASPRPSASLPRQTSLPPVSAASSSAVPFSQVRSDLLSSEGGSGSGDGDELRGGRQQWKLLPPILSPLPPPEDHTPLMESSSQDRPQQENPTTEGTFQMPDNHTGLPQPSKAQSTQGWMIIVAFIAGIAALVMLCVAIATRDKWNGPRKPSQPQHAASASVQQVEQEMETFMHKEQPRENGKAAEYTVIPLEELPQDYSAQ